MQFLARSLPPQNYSCAMSASREKTIVRVLTSWPQRFTVAPCLPTEECSVGSQHGTKELQLCHACQQQCIALCDHNLGPQIYSCPMHASKHVIYGSQLATTELQLCLVCQERKGVFSVVCSHLAPKDLHLCHAGQQRNAAWAPSMAPKNYSCAMPANNNVLLCVATTWGHRFTAAQCMPASM